MASSSAAPSSASAVAAAVAAALLLAAMGAEAETRKYEFNVQMASVTRLCGTKSIVTVNGQCPGPTLLAREGDRVEVNVVNRSPYNVSLHWHGVRQLLSGWADGPSYITQCPIQPGQSYVYRYRIVGQRGTLWWHAHISWFRATLYGPIVILPPAGVPYPFPAPDEEVAVMFGEWWRNDTEAVIAQALQTGGGPNISDAYTISGLPGWSEGRRRTGVYGGWLAALDVDGHLFGGLPTRRDVAAALPTLSRKGLPRFCSSLLLAVWHKPTPVLGNGKGPSSIPFFHVDIGH